MYINQEHVSALNSPSFIVTLTILDIQLYSHKYNPACHDPKLKHIMIALCYNTVTFCYGQPNGVTTSSCRIHKNVFKLYLWCVDDFLTD